MPISPSRRRKLLVERSFWRISVSLCCTSGCERTWTSGVLELKADSSSKSTYSAVARHPHRRQAAIAPLGRDRTAGGPGAAFEQARQRKRRFVDPEQASHLRRKLVEQAHRECAPLDGPAVARLDRLL